MKNVNGKQFQREKLVIDRNDDTKILHNIIKILFEYKLNFRLTNGGSRNIKW